ncbi:MAG: alpha/beta hydrolase [Pseudomonadota bacterium]
MQLHWTTKGEGEPLLLLHGFTGVGADWEVIFDGKDIGYERLMPDLPGHGRSPCFDEFSFRDSAEQILSDLLEMGHVHVPAIGMSGGGQVLLHMATMDTQRIGKTVLVSAAPYFPATARKLMALSGPENQTEEAWAAMRLKHPGGDDQIRALFQASRAFEDSFDDVNFTPPLLGRIRHPTLIVHGDRDPLYPPAMAYALYDAIPKANLWILPGEGHCPVFEDHAEAFRKTAVSFLRR